MPDEPTTAPQWPEPRSGAQADQPVPRAHRPPRAPSGANIARRMLATTIAITAIVAFGVVGWRALRGDDPVTGRAVRTWSRIAFVDRTTGGVVVIDGDGEHDRRIVGRGRVSDVYAVDDRLALVGAEQIVIEGADDPFVVPIERGSTVTPIRTTDTLHLVVGEPAGGNVSIVDVSTGDVLDVAAIAEQGSPRIFAETIRWSTGGDRFAVADAGAFQTIVVEAGEDAARFFAGQPLALDDDLIATTQVVGRQADVALLDRDRRSKATVPAEIPAGGVFDDGELVMVSTQGEVFRVAEGDAEPRRIGRVSVPSGGTVAWVAPTLDGERLVVAGSVFEAVVDLDGEVLFTTTFTEPVVNDHPRPEWACLPVGGDGTYHSLVSLDTGGQLADLAGLEIEGTSRDGCTVLGRRDGVAEVIDADDSVSIGEVRAATLGPEGRTVILTTTAGATELVHLGDDLEPDDPVELDVPADATVVFLD